MKKHLECLAIIPARGGSKGVPRKNLRLVNGKPLIQYTIEAALGSCCIDEAAVSTDCPEIAAVSAQAGANVPFMRPAALAGDHSTTIDVLKHAVEFYEQELHIYFEHIVLLQPTSPLRNSKDIEKAYGIFLQNNADSLQSVSPAAQHPYLLRKFEDMQLKPYQAVEDERLRRQDLEELYVLNGAIYIVKKEILMNENSLVGRKNCGYIMPRSRSIDIDDELDLEVAQVLLQKTTDL
ncbi:acylneuraminate cytidylyltransferase family protein [Paenibacillus sp. DMB20]|uniref:acylneuraminate cytidylyltransferase family protein n=1 Tax=Paenibacillus sp. DMB20 TaxID=1642570 RepID=UPI0006279991|nr:acylneuraminate cytidylyltransferase family protein [Paenibacillus sp. DMB20]KKO54971.1 flagellar modification protein B [Paenibacillus sp. DMB20]